MLPSFITALAALVTGVLALYPNDHTKGRRRRLLVPCAVFTFVAAIWSAFNADLQSKAFAKKQDEIGVTQAEVISSQRKLADAQYDLISAQTGKGSVPYLKPFFQRDAGATGIEFCIYKDGEWPVYDATFEIADQSYIRDLPGISVVDRHRLVEDHTTRFHVPVIPLPRTFLNHMVDLTGRDSLSLRIRTTARNGVWIERLSVRRIEEERWVPALTVTWENIALLTSTPEGDVIRKELAGGGEVVRDIHPRFPRSASGEPLW